MACEDFPQLDLNDSISNKVQTALPWGDETTETSIAYLGAAEDSAFERYVVLHQVEREMDAFFNQQAVRRLIENRRFPAYYFRDRGYFLVGARDRDTSGMFDRLATGDVPVHATKEEIDLTTVMALGKTTGAYFGNLRIDKVRTAAVFGTTTVVESEEWSHYAELGDLKVIYMRMMADDGEVRVVQLLRDRSVVLMKNDTERADLCFVRELQASIDQLLSP